MLADARVLTTIASNDSKLLSSPLRGPPSSALNWEPPAISGRAPAAPQPPQQQRRRPTSASCCEADPFALPNEAARAPKAARTSIANEPSRDPGGGGGGGGSLFPFTMKREDSMTSLPPKTRRSRSDVTPLRAPPLLSQQPHLPAVGHSSYDADGPGPSGVLARLKAKEPVVGFPSPFKDLSPTSGGGLPPVAPSALMRGNRFSSGTAGGISGGPGPSGSGRAPPPLNQQASATDLPMRQATQSPQRGAQQSPQRLPPPSLQNGGGQTGQWQGGQQPSPQRRSQRSSGGGGPLPQLLPRLGPPQSGQFGQGTIRMSSGNTVRVQESLTFDDDGNEIEDDGIGIPRSRFLASLARDSNVAPWSSR